ncbi:glycerophosphodiester phosphodiesterase family protein [Hymenobacter canadensis]|uniref:Glycerophosphodiester phosphodiesterase family protein n=1 Tax=Hymenobacter canadensis TaxID=2999067 RepID=A0ABY7LQJ3_9BACT|nr:glycerophosphodiester phosphodiesterase family protein [Hymenobacter canadensis]WBA41168.1 glycerophosphodiester phosphodiesterase family protein [Hymenobacter canadensis]
MPTSHASLAHPEVHGHRGCRGLFPENTLPAFLHAVRLGVTVLELDVVLSADGQVVVSHEPWMSAAICLDHAGQPIPAATQQQHNLYRMPYAQIRRYDCGRRQHPAFPAQQNLPAHKPLLREVVAATDQLARELGQAPPRFSLEVKSEPAGDNLFHPAPPAYVAVVLAELCRLDLERRTTLLCFDVRILQEARRQLPGLPLCLLVEDEVPLTEHLLQLGFVPEVYGPCHDLVTPQLVTEAAQDGLLLVPWTVNDPADMRRLTALGVAGITTDYPDRLLQLYTQA